MGSQSALRNLTWSSSVAKYSMTDFNYDPVSVDHGQQLFLWRDGYLLVCLGSLCGSPCCSVFLNIMEYHSNLFFPEHHHLRSCWNLLVLSLPREHGGRFPDAAAPAPAPPPCPWPWARAPALEPAIISCSCSAVSWMIPCVGWSDILAASVKLLVSTYPFSGSTLYHNTVNLKKTDESLT